GNFLITETGVLAGNACQQRFGQQQQIPFALSKRRQVQYAHSNAVEQVFAEAPLGDFLHQVAVGGGNQPHIDLELLVGADWGEGAFLQYTQQSHLYIWRQLTELIEKQRAAVSLLEHP